MNQLDRAWIGYDRGSDLLVLTVSNVESCVWR